jgi:hypothetical protein
MTLVEIALMCGQRAEVPPELARHPLLLCPACCTAQPFVTAAQVAPGRG